MKYEQDYIEPKKIITLEDVKDNFVLNKESIDLELSIFDTFEEYVDYFWNNFSHNICDVTLK